MVGLATQGSSKPRRVLQIDEVAGSVGRIVLGETRADVVSVLGRPRSAHGSSLVYEHLSVAFGGGRVDSIETDDPSAGFCSRTFP